MECPEKDVLLRAYNAAAHAYSGALADMQKKLEASTPDDYAFLSRVIKHARAESQRTRLQYQRHVDEHGC